MPILASVMCLRLDHPCLVMLTSLCPTMGHQICMKERETTEDVTKADKVLNLDMTMLNN